MNRRRFASQQISNSSSNIPYLSSTSFNKDFRSRWFNRLPRSSSSSMMRFNPEQQRQELDLIIKQLSNGKVFHSIADDRTSSVVSETISKRSIITDDEDEDEDELPDVQLDDDEDQPQTPKQSDLFSFDGDRATLQRELQEKELDIRHLQKEIQELRLDNRVLRDKLPIFQSNPRTTEFDALQRENDLLRNELRSLQEILAKSSTVPPGQFTRSNRFDQERESWMKKLRDYEKQLRTLTAENEKVKQTCQQFERTINQLKREKDELEEKVIQTKKQNEDLLMQELHSLRQDLKLLQERHHRLFEENHRLRKEKSGNLHPPTNDTSLSTSEENETISMKYNGQNRSIYSIYPSNGSREEFYPYSRSTSKYSFHRTEPKVEQPQQPNKDESSSSLYKSFSKGLKSRTNADYLSNRRPYAPLSISDIRLNDLVKFSRPGGQTSRGIVKYIGTLPDRSEPYLGLELEDEESQHDGVFQGQRYFQSKPNKGVFVSFNKVIMAYREK